MKAILTVFVVGFILFPTILFAGTASLSDYHVKQGQSTYVSWSGFPSNVNIVLYDGGSFVAYANTTATGTGSQELNTSGWGVSSGYRIKIEDKTNTSNYVYTNYLSVSNPQASLSRNPVSVGEVTTVAWSGFASTVNIAVYKGNSFWLYANTTASGSGNQGLDTTGWEARNDYEIKVVLKADTSITAQTNSLSVSSSYIPPVKITSLEFESRDSYSYNSILDWREVHPNPIDLIIRVNASKQNIYTHDQIIISLDGEYTNYSQDVILNETGVNTGIYESDIVTINPSSALSGGYSRSVFALETQFWGDGDLFTSSQNPFGEMRGKAHGIGLINQYPAANKSAMRAGGYEMIRIVPYDASFDSSNVLRVIFVKNQANWLLYSGDGISSITCPSDYGFVELLQHELNYCQFTDSKKMYPENLVEGDWSNVEIAIFASCSMFDKDEPYGIKWFQANGPRYFLGYKGSGPGSNIDENVLMAWRQGVDGVFGSELTDPANAWMDANKSYLAWNASSYDKVKQEYCYFRFLTHSKKCVSLDVNDSDFTIAVSGGSGSLEEPNGLTVASVLSNQITVTWNEVTTSQSNLRYGVYQNGQELAIANSTSFTSTGLTSSSNYCFQVIAITDEDESGLSSQVCATASEGSGSGGGETNLPSPPHNLIIVH